MANMTSAKCIWNRYLGPGVSGTRCTWDQVYLGPGVPGTRCIWDQVHLGPGVSGTRCIRKGP